jgi:uncharacterized spore protein YtfJ
MNDKRTRRGPAADETPAAPEPPVSTGVSSTSGPEAAASAEAALGAAHAGLGRFLDTADARRAWGEPLVHGDTAVLPAAEVVTVAGFGMGGGAGRDPSGDGGGGGGGGGGGKTFSRAVAAVVVTPHGVEVHPVLDWTKVALAALTAGSFVVAGWLRSRKALSKGLHD